MTTFSFYETISLFDEKYCTFHIVDSSSETLQADIWENQYKHKRNITNDDVTAISIRNSPKIDKLLAIAVNDTFKNIRALVIISTGLKEISMNAFIGLESLTELQIERNKNLVSLPGDLFQNMPRLQYISFRNNNIKFIGKDLLKPQNEIKFIDLRGNVTINAHHGTHKYETNPGVTLKELSIMIRKRCQPMNPVSSCADDVLRFWKEGLFFDFIIRGEHNQC